MLLFKYQTYLQYFVNDLGKYRSYLLIGGDIDGQPCDVFLWQCVTSEDFVMGTMGDTCPVCSAKNPDKICGGCRFVRYCSRECQVIIVQGSLIDTHSLCNNILIYLRMYSEISLVQKSASA